MNDWFEAEQHAERAHQFYESGQWDQALSEIKRAIRFNPHQAEWHFGMGLTLDALDRFDEAIPCYEQALALQPGNVEIMLHLGVDLLHTQEYTKAVDVLHGVHEVDKECETAYCYLVLAYTRLGDHDTAEQMFYLARQITEQCPVCYDHMARSLFERGDTDRAIWCWQQTRRIDPQYPQICSHLARAHERKGQLNRAKQLHMQQLRDDPGDIDAMLALGELLIRMDRPAEAAEKFRRVLELDPGVAAAHLSLAKLALRAGHLDAAESHLDRARRMTDGMPELFLTMARVAQQRGQQRLARRLAVGEVEYARNNPALAVELTYLLIELGEGRPVVELLSPLIDEVRPKLVGDESADAKKALVVMLLHRGVGQLIAGRMRGGIRDLQELLDIQPGHVQALRNLVEAHIELGDHRRAAVWLRRARVAAPDDIEVRLLSYRLSLARIGGAVKRLLGRS